MDNPLLDAWFDHNQASEACDCGWSRDDFCNYYSWAVPDDNALEAIGRYGPVVEIGAGTGYWANQLDAYGVDVVAYDIAPTDQGENTYHSTESFYPVKQGGPEAVKDHPDRTLLLCWPTPDTVPVQAALLHEGRYLVYIGEDPDICGECCGGRTFFDLLDRYYTQVERVDIPQWPDCDDALWVYERNA